MHPLVFKENGKRIGIEGQEYHDHIDENMIDDYRMQNLNVDFSILVTHSMLLDHEFFTGVKHTIIDDVQTSADLVLAGHYHPGFKEREKDGVWFYNPGSMLRIENTAENHKNRPKVMIIDIDAETATFTSNYVELQSAKPGDEVFAEKVDTTQYKADLQSFHQKLKAKQFKGVDIIALVEEYAKENNEDVTVVEAVKDMMNQFAANVAVDNGYIPSVGTIYITKVELFNFQAHEHKVVDFTKGLNVIKGESNSGKTAILRGIYWCLYDKPNGSDFIRTGAKSAKVKLHLSNGYIIERKRNRSSSGNYNLIDPTGAAQEFKGFSNNIPIEITNAHQMPEVNINGTKYRINIASQLDPAFLIGNSPAERISMIGSLVNADRADEAKKQFSADKRKISTEKAKVEGLLKDKQEDLEKYDYLPKLKHTIDTIEMAINKLKTDEDKIVKYEEIRKYYMQAKTALTIIDQRLSEIKIPSEELIKEYKSLIANIESFNKLNEDYIQSKKIDCAVDRAIASIPDVKSLKSYAEGYKRHLDKLELMSNLASEHEQLSSLSFEFNYDLDELNKLIAGYKGLISNIELASNLLNERNSYSSKLEQIKLEIADKAIKAQELADAKSAKLKELEVEDLICPTCHQKIDVETALNGGC